MARLVDLSPLELCKEGNKLRFSLKQPEELIVELPPDYETFLSKQLGEILADETQPEAEIDLGTLTAISSRQLGSLIALQKILRPQVGRIRLTGVSPAVRHLLELTRTDQLFELP